MPRPRVLITGASGFVGSHVAQLLVTEGWDVHAIVRSAAARDAVARAAPGTVLHDADLLDSDALQRALEGCTVAINCAAIYRWWLRDVSAYERVNVEGVAELLKAAAAMRVQKVVQVSTILAFGCPPGYGSAERPLTPDLHPGPTASRYAATKAAGDALALQLGRELGVGVCVVQLACVIGRDPKLLRPHDDTMRMRPLVQGKVPATFASSTVYTYVDVGDAARAIVRAAEQGREGARYFVGDQRLTTGEFYSLLADLSGCPAPCATVPLWLAQLWANASAAWSALVSGVPPQAPPDLIQTVVAGTLLFDASAADAELGLPPYRPIQQSFAEAVAFIRAADCAPGGAPAAVPAASVIGAPVTESAKASASADAAASSGQQAPLHAHVALPWFDLLASGAKTVEGRLARGAWAALAPGDVLELTNEVRSAPWRARVASTARYGSFAELLCAEGLHKVLPDASVSSLEDGVAVYRRFYSEEEEALWGALAVRVEALAA